MKYMVFDVGGTAIKYSVMDEELRIYEKGEVPTPADTREHFYQVLEDSSQPSCSTGYDGSAFQC